MTQQRSYTIDARKLTLPVVVIIGMVLFFMSATWMLSEERNRIFAAIETNKVAITKLEAQNQRLSENFARRARNLWDLNDMHIWCLTADRDNPDFKCPDPKSRRGDD